MFKKTAGILLSASLLFTFVGCTPHDGAQSSPSPSPTAPAEQVFTNLTDNFVLLSEAVVPSSLPPVVYDGEYPSEVQGEGVLCGDKTVSITLKTDGSDVNVSVDGKSLSFYAENFMGANIVDLKKGDNLYELAVYSEGPSADPSVAFVRYDGTNLKNIMRTVSHETFSYTSESLDAFLGADADDILPTYGPLWTNQNGIVITPFQQIGFTTPRIALSYYVLENDTWTEHEVPIKADETYTVSNDFKAFFTPMDMPPVDYAHFSLVQNYDLEARREFKKGQTMKLLGYGEMHGYYTFYVDIDGEKGVLAFWTGD